jgi:hypothetical protein
MTINYLPGGALDRFFSPARAFAFRTFFSGTSFVLHVVSAVMLGVSPVISDEEPAAEEYRIGYLIGLSLICISCVLTGQQTYATGLAAWRLKGSREDPRVRNNI